MNHIHYHRFYRVLSGAILAIALIGLVPSQPLTTQAQTGGPLGYGSKVYGTISSAAPLVTYSFTGSEGDFVTATVDNWTGALDAQLELVAPNGVLLAYSTQNTLAGDPLGAYLSVFLPEAGSYLLRISGENGTTGDYLLALLGRSPAESTPLVFGQAITVEVPQNAVTQFFSFEAEACPTTLLVSDPSLGQPYTFPYIVMVYDQRGQRVALLRGGDQLEDWITVQPKSGRYEVQVRAVEPSLAGSIRLLVTCSGDNPGCPAGQPGLAGVPGLADCVPCPGPDQPSPGGGCPDLNLRVEQGLHMSTATTVFWDPMPGATGYVVFVRGLVEGGGEVYLTRAEWVPGDPTEFTWILPVEGYLGYRFTLDVLFEGDVICTQHVVLYLEETSPECTDLGLEGLVTDETVNAVALSWLADPEADQYDLDIYSIVGASEEYSGRLVLPGGATGRAFDHFPPHLDGVRFVLWKWVAGRLCSDELTLMFGGQQYVCPPLGLAVTALDPVSRSITLSWFGFEDIEGYQIDVYGTDAGGAETLIDSTGLPASVLTSTYTYPEGYVMLRFVLRLLGGPIECSEEIVVMPQTPPPGECADFALSVTAATGSQVDLEWTAYPGADGFGYLLMDEARNPVPGHSVIMSAAQLNLVLLSPPLAPGVYIVNIGPWDDVAGLICAQEVTITFGGTPGGPCLVRADRQGVQVRVGPGLDRSVFAFMPIGVDIPVVGQSTDGAGNVWWQIDQSYIPGGEAAASLWVAAGDVTETGDCSQVPSSYVPPVIPGDDLPDEQPGGGWGPCGSCDTCGHPVNECVTSPEGACLWDPATCLAPAPGGDDGGACYAVTAAIDMGQCYGGGSAMIDTPPNCEGGRYLPGTTISAHAVAVDPKCTVQYWSGCGVSGGGASISFVPPGSCTVTAHMGY